MDNLFSARHGSYDGNYRISDEGREQILKLVDAIQEITGEQGVYLLSSIAPRAIDSANIIAEGFGIEINIDPYLWSANDAPLGEESYMWNPDRRRLLDVVQSREDEADNLIVVSHYGVAEDLVSGYMERGLVAGDLRELEYGEAINLNLADGTQRIIPSS